MAKTNKKPKAKVIGENGNVFNLIAICGLSLKKVGQEEKYSEMKQKIFKCHSYDEALMIMSDYCELV
jgi:hypothetical protein